MYSYLLYIHSWTRWAVLILAVINIFNSYRGWKGLKEHSEIDNKLSLLFVSSVHFQGTLGLLLYFFFSPHALNSILHGLPFMSNDILRFWSIEHIFAMIIAIILITIGRVKAKKEKDSHQKFKKQFIYFGLGILMILSALPYQESGRWLRF